MVGKGKNMSVWTEAGYDLFAHEGIEGIQVERLARILGLNKSGFYHYFGDLEMYMAELIKLHIKRADRYNEDLRKLTSIDPGYIKHAVDYKLEVMFNLQLVRMPDNHPYHILADQIDKTENERVANLWSNYLGVDVNSDLGTRYLDIVRATFYGRVNFKNYDIPFFRGLLEETKELINKFSDLKSEKDESYI